MTNEILILALGLSTIASSFVVFGWVLLVMFQ